MSKTATVYSIPGCPRCVNAKNTLEALGYDVVVLDGEALGRGDIHDNEALTELTMNGGTFPVVVVEDRAVREGDELFNLIQEHKEW